MAYSAVLADEKVIICGAGTSERIVLIPLPEGEAPGQSRMIFPQWRHWSEPPQRSAPCLESAGLRIQPGKTRYNTVRRQHQNPG